MMDPFPKCPKHVLRITSGAGSHRVWSSSPGVHHFAARIAGMLGKLRARTRLPCHTSRSGRSGSLLPLLSARFHLFHRISHVFHMYFTYFTFHSNTEAKAIVVIAVGD